VRLYALDGLALLLIISVPWNQLFSVLLAVSRTNSLVKWLSWTRRRRIWLVRKIDRTPFAAYSSRPLNILLLR
jgi:hypothetical protein